MDHSHRNGTDHTGWKGPNPARLEKIFLEISHVTLLTKTLLKDLSENIQPQKKTTIGWLIFQYHKGIIYIIYDIVCIFVH